MTCTVAHADSGRRGVRKAILCVMPAGPYARPALEGTATVTDGVIPDHRTRPPQSKTAYVVERLREEIAAGVIVAGAPLRQTEIASRYGVSPTPVREALRILEAAGTIVYSPNRGATVREMHPTDGDDLYRLRAEMEGFACELSVQRRGADLAPELELIVKQLEALDPARDHARCTGSTATFTS